MIKKNQKKGEFLRIRSILLDATNPGESSIQINVFPMDIVV